ncbi:MAG: hypothetical protein KKB03_02555 [Nanoarchaeota archaeon]|nr:hypothetical protein [Nanoarchaeota archaeon]MBU1135734.1 hypothetical protein [Nanoarchaeota archaeon]MBU2520099.1 hypothetical protein [Nanoarchaeota archaeon]
MADIFGSLFNLETLYAFANSQGYMYWLNLGISIILTTIIGGIVLIVLSKVLSRWTGNISNYGHAFMVVLVINIINFFGILGILLGFLYGIPFLGLILPVIVWIGLLKVFFGELNTKGVIILGVISYILSMTLIPILVSTAGSFIMI